MKEKSKKKEVDNEESRGGERRVQARRSSKAMQKTDFISALRHMVGADKTNARENEEEKEEDKEEVQEQFEYVVERENVQEDQVGTMREAEEAEEEGRVLNTEELDAALFTMVDNTDKMDVDDTNTMLTCMEELRTACAAEAPWLAKAEENVRALDAVLFPAVPGDVEPIVADTRDQASEEPGMFTFTHRADAAIAHGDDGAGGDCESDEDILLQELDKTAKDIGDKCDAVDAVHRRLRLFEIPFAATTAAKRVAALPSLFAEFATKRGKLLASETVCEYGQRIVRRLFNPSAAPSGPQVTAASVCEFATKLELADVLDVTPYTKHSSVSPTSRFDKTVEKAEMIVPKLDAGTGKDGNLAERDAGTTSSDLVCLPEFFMPDASRGVVENLEVDASNLRQLCFGEKDIDTDKVSGIITNDAANKSNANDEDEDEDEEGPRDTKRDVESSVARERQHFSSHTQSAAPVVVSPLDAGVEGIADFVMRENEPQGTNTSLLAGIPRLPPTRVHRSSSVGTPVFGTCRRHLANDADAHRRSTSLVAALFSTRGRGDVFWTQGGFHERTSGMDVGKDGVLTGFTHAFPEPSLARETLYLSWTMSTPPRAASTLSLGICGDDSKRLFGIMRSCEGRNVNTFVTAIRNDEMVLKEAYCREDPAITPKSISDAFVPLALDDIDNDDDNDDGIACPHSTHAKEIRRRRVHDLGVTTLAGAGPRRHRTNVAKPTDGPSRASDDQTLTPESGAAAAAAAAAAEAQLAPLVASKKHVVGPVGVQRVTYTLTSSLRSLLRVLSKEVNGALKHSTGMGDDMLPISTTTLRKISSVVSTQVKVHGESTNYLQSIRSLTGCFVAVQTAITLASFGVPVASLYLRKNLDRYSFVRPMFPSSCESLFAAQRSLAEGNFTDHPSLFELRQTLRKVPSGSKILIVASKIAHHATLSTICGTGKRPIQLERMEAIHGARDRRHQSKENALNAKGNHDGGEAATASDAAASGGVTSDERIHEIISSCDCLLVTPERVRDIDKHGAILASFPFARFRAVIELSECSDFSLAAATSASTARTNGRGALCDGGPEQNEKESIVFSLRLVNTNPNALYFLLKLEDKEIDVRLEPPKNALRNIEVGDDGAARRFHDGDNGGENQTSDASKGIAHKGHDEEMRDCPASGDDHGKDRDEAAAVVANEIPRRIHHETFDTKNGSAFHSQEPMNDIPRTRMEGMHCTADDDYNNKENRPPPPSPLPRERDGLYSAATRPDHRPQHIGVLGAAHCHRSIRGGNDTDVRMHSHVHARTGSIQSPVHRVSTLRSPAPARTAAGWASSCDDGTRGGAYPNVIDMDTFAQTRGMRAPQNMRYDGGCPLHDDINGIHSTGTFNAGRGDGIDRLRFNDMSASPMHYPVRDARSDGLGPPPTSIHRFEPMKRQRVVDSFFGNAPTQHALHNTIDRDGPMPREFDLASTGDRFEAGPAFRGATASMIPNDRGLFDARNNGGDLRWQQQQQQQQRDQHQRMEMNNNPYHSMQPSMQTVFGDTEYMHTPNYGLENAKNEHPDAAGWENSPSFAFDLEDSDGDLNTPFTGLNDVHDDDLSEPPVTRAGTRASPMMGTEDDGCRHRGGERDSPGGGLHARSFPTEPNGRSGSYQYRFNATRGGAMSWARLMPSSSTIPPSGLQARIPRPAFEQHSSVARAAQGFRRMQPYLQVEFVHVRMRLNDLCMYEHLTRASRRIIVLIRIHHSCMYVCVCVCVCVCAIDLRP